MADFDYDLFVIGAGSGGVRAARIAAALKARVAIAERGRVGGTCVIRGCVPKKLLVYAAHFRADFEDAKGYGWTVGEPTFSWAELIANKNREIARLEGLYVGLLQRAGVTLLRSNAHVVGPNAIEIQGHRVSAKHILVATGGAPVLPRIPGIEHAITSDEAFELAALPARVLIVGGGYIAAEFAGIFNGLGSQVTMAYRGDEILRGFDDDVRRHMHVEMVKRGIRVMLHTEIESIERRSDGTLAARVVGDRSILECDAVMFATGRAPNTRDLGLEAAGVKLGERGEVVVDAYSRATVPSIYGVGDVTNRINLTPVALREGHAVALTLFGGVPTPSDHSNVPTAVFSQPPIGAVGMTESEAQAAYAELDIYKTTFYPLKSTLSGRDERTLMKLIVDAATQRIVGAHMVGTDAPEIIQSAAIAVKAGLTKAQFDTTVGIHPTASEEFVTMREKTVVQGHAKGPAALAHGPSQ